MLSDLVGTVSSVVNGGERYLAATKVGFELEQSYRSYRNQAGDLSPLAQRKLLEQTHFDGAKKLTKLFHDNGAIWVKFGQFLSSRSDILPMQYVMELGKHQNDAKPISFRKINQVLSREWGNRWRDRFLSFDEQAVAAASVAQVHKAVLKNGEEVAVKVQLPNARKLFRQDSVVFKALGRVGSALVSHFDLKQVMDQIIEMTMEELDFLTEEQNLKKFASLPHDPFIHVPVMYEELSTSRVLVTEWIDGVKLTDYLDRNPLRAELILRQLLSSYTRQITEFGVYHADPHPGNFLVMKDERIAVLDYGAVGRLSTEDALNYGLLLNVLFGRVQIDTPLGDLFKRAGFVARDQAVFEEVAELVLKENLRQQEATDILAHALDKMRDLKVTIPDSFVSVARVVLTFGGLLKMYNVQPPE